jgi:hypothetical protein
MIVDRIALRCLLRKDDMTEAVSCGMIFAKADSSHIIRKQMQGREEYFCSDMKRAGVWWKAGMDGRRKMVLEQAV